MHSWHVRALGYIWWVAPSRRLGPGEEPEPPATGWTNILSGACQPPARPKFTPTDGSGGTVAKPPPAVELVDIWRAMVLLMDRRDPRDRGARGEGWSITPLDGDSARDTWRKAFRNIAYESPDAVGDAQVDNRTRQMESFGLVQRRGKLVVLCTPKEWVSEHRRTFPIPPATQEWLNQVLLKDERGAPVDALPRKTWNDTMRLIMGDVSNQTVRRLTVDLEELGLVQRREGGRFVELREGFPEVFERWTRL